MNSFFLVSKISSCQTYIHYGNISERRKAGIAQLVEQMTENPRVTSSNLVPGNFYTLLFSR
jgi:hypothetical protein